MATVHFDAVTTDFKVFTPVSSALGALSNGPGTMIVLVKQTTTGLQDFCGLVDSGDTLFYHSLISNTGPSLFDDDGAGSVGAAGTWTQDTTNWYLLAVDWTAGTPSNFRFRSQTALGSWTSSASAGNGPANKAGPGTGGWFRIGYIGDSAAGAKDQAVVAVWNTRFSTGDYSTAWNKTSDLWNHPLGRPIFLSELNSGTPVDLVGGSTYSSGNSSGTALTGADPDNWTFDGLGSTSVPRTFNPIPFMGGVL